MINTAITSHHSRMTAITRIQDLDMVMTTVGKIMVMIVAMTAAAGVIITNSRAAIRIMVTITAAAAIIMVSRKVTQITAMTTAALIRIMVMTVAAAIRIMAMITAAAIRIMVMIIMDIVIIMNRAAKIRKPVTDMTTASRITANHRLLTAVTAITMSSPSGSRSHSRVPEPGQGKK